MKDGEHIQDVISVGEIKNGQWLSNFLWKQQLEMLDKLEKMDDEEDKIEKQVRFHYPYLYQLVTYSSIQ
jgi:hypothetical protein